MIITHWGHPLLWMSTVDDGANLAAQDGKSGQPEAQIEPTTKPNLSVKSSPTKGKSNSPSQKNPKDSPFRNYQAHDNSDAFSETSTIVGDDLMESFSDITVMGLDHKKTPNHTPKSENRTNDQQLSSKLITAATFSDDEPIVTKIINHPPSKSEIKSSPSHLTAKPTATNKNQMAQTTLHSKSENQTPKRKKSADKSPDHQNKRQCQFPLHKPSYANVMQTQGNEELTNQEEQTPKPRSFVAYILPSDHSELSTDQGNHIRDSLVNLLYPKQSQTPAPARFLQYGLTQALFKITCADADSVEWIINVTKHIPPFEDTEFVAFRGNELPKYISLTTFFPRKKGCDIPSIRSRLMRSNPHLHIPSWKVYWAVDKDGFGLQICFGIPESEVEKLKADNYTAWFELSYVTFNWARNPAPSAGTSGSSNQIRPSKPSGSSGSNAASSGATGQSNPPHQNKAHKPSSSQGTFKKPNTPLTTRPKQAQNTRQNHNNNNPHQNNSQQGQVRSRPQGNRPEANFRPPPPIRHTTPIGSPTTALVPLMNLKLPTSAQTSPRRGLEPSPKSNRHHSQ